LRAQFEAKSQIRGGSQRRTFIIGNGDNDSFRFFFPPNPPVEKDSVLLSIESTSIQLDKTITADALQRQKQELDALLPASAALILR